MDDVILTEDEELERLVSIMGARLAKSDQQHAKEVTEMAARIIRLSDLKGRLDHLTRNRFVLSVRMEALSARFTASRPSEPPRS